MIAVPAIHAGFFDFSKSKTPAKKVERSERGIEDSKKDLYSVKVFKCDNDNKILTNSQINDDYCDCSDGTDEPGTSACSGTAFVCKNQGYKPITIPSSRVDDGICDCCDGSDEGNVPNLECYDICDEVAQREMAELIQMRNDYNKGKEEREKYINSVKSNTLYSIKDTNEIDMKYEKENERLEILKEVINKENDAMDVIRENFLVSTKESHEITIFNILGLDNIKSEEIPILVVAYISMMEPSIADVLQALDPDGTNDEEYVNPENEYDDDHMNYRDDDDDDDDSIDDNNNNEEVKIDTNGNIESNDIPKDCLLAPVSMLIEKKNSDVLEEICRNINSRMVDVTNKKLLWFLAEIAGILSANSDGGNNLVRAITQLHLLALQPDKLKTGQSSIDNLKLPDGETCITPLTNDQCIKHLELNDLLNEIRLDSDMKNKAPITIEQDEKLAQLKEEMRLAEDMVKNLQTEKNNIVRAAKEYELHQDHLEWLHLNKECYIIKGGEFTYDVCVMGAITQRDASGSRVTLGNYENIEHDEKFTKLKYGGGQHCWNHGARAAEVKVTCGATNSILEVSEPATCFYTFKMTSPAKCTPQVGSSLGL